MAGVKAWNVCLDYGNMVVLCKKAAAFSFLLSLEGRLR
jgi:hypothetical protein